MEINIYFQAKLQVLISVRVAVVGSIVCRLAYFVDPNSDWKLDNVINYKGNSWTQILYLQTKVIRIEHKVSIQVIPWESKLVDHVRQPLKSAERTSDLVTAWLAQVLLTYIAINTGSCTTRGNELESKLLNNTENSFRVNVAKVDISIEDD